MFLYAAPEKPAFIADKAAEIGVVFRMGCTVKDRNTGRPILARFYDRAERVATASSIPVYWVSLGGRCQKWPGP